MSTIDPALGRMLGGVTDDSGGDGGGGLLDRLFWRSGEGGGLSTRDARSMALLEAMQSVGEAGTRRTASPIGSIAQALGPLLMAPIQARQMERQSALQDLLLRAKIADLLRGSGQATSPEELELTKAKTKRELAEAAKAEMEASSPFGGKSPSDTQVEIGAMQGDPMMKQLLDFQSARKQAERVAESALVAERSASLLDQREAAADAKRRNARLPTNQVYVDKATGERLPFKRVADLEDSGIEAIPLAPQQASTVSDIKNAYRELQALKGAASKILYDAKPTDGILGQIFGVQTHRAKIAAKARGGDPDVRIFEATKKSAALALARALTRTGRVPVAEFGAIDALDAGKDTVQSASAILNNFEGYLTGVLHDYGLDPSILQAEQVGVPGISSGARPVSAHTPGPSSSVPEFDLTPEAAGLKQAYSRIKSQHPKWTDSEIVDYYLSTKK